MSTTRLTLKQPTGWFAAGREVAQALAVLSDGAFKLYIHLCLQADRHTARARIELTGLARVLRKTPAHYPVELRNTRRNRRPRYLIRHRRVCQQRLGTRIDDDAVVGDAERMLAS